MYAGSLTYEAVKMITLAAKQISTLCLRYSLVKGVKYLHRPLLFSISS